MNSTENISKPTKPTKSAKTKAEILELIVVIFLGVTALFTAWASWMGSLHGGNQATAYTESNNIAADGNARWNEAAQNLSRDMAVWDQIYNLRIEQEFAYQQNNATEIEKLQWQIDSLTYNNISDELQSAIDWADAQSEYVSPFAMEGFIDSYFADANAVLSEASEVLEVGKQANSDGDTFGLVSVIYSIVLFLLGICNTFKSEKNQLVVTAISGVILVATTVFMFTIPTPEGFALFSFFKGV